MFLPYRYPLIIAVACLLTFSSCSSRRRLVEESPADRVANRALEYQGIPYRYGGTDSSGMDCSGLVYRSMMDEGYAIPRVSHQMAGQGRGIKLREVQRGDLLFFKTPRNPGRINHVGLVVDVRSNEIYFIHSTSGRGVIVSSLDERYWQKAFKRARRVL